MHYWSHIKTISTIRLSSNQIKCSCSAQHGLTLSLLPVKNIAAKITTVTVNIVIKRN